MINLEAAIAQGRISRAILNLDFPELMRQLSILYRRAWKCQLEALASEERIEWVHVGAVVRSFKDDLILQFGWERFNR